MKITYIHHSSFLVETESAYLLFDYFQGKLPEFSEEKPLYVFASHRHPDHFSKVIFDLEEKHPNIQIFWRLISGVSGFRNLVKERQNF